MPRFKSYDGGKKLERFSRKTAKVAEASSDSWRSGKTSSQRGYDSRWQRAREKYLQENPLCGYCGRAGIITPATIIDHIEPHRGDRDKFWNEANWQPLCKRHHDDKTKREGRMKGFVRTKIKIISGPPCSGKTTFVNLNKSEGDLVLDFDALASAMGSAQTHGATGLIKEAAQVARKAVMDFLLSSGFGGAAWVIDSEPDAATRKAFTEIGAEFRLIPATKATCLERAKKDKRPQKTFEAIEEWFDGKK